MKIKLFIILFVPLFSLITISGLIDWLSYYPKLNKEYQTIVNYGYLGSFLSGVTSLVIVALTVVAVYFSYKAYMQEIERVRQQRFEDRFYHLLAMHRDNVNEMIIDLGDTKLEGSKVILNMFRELEVIVKILNIKEICEKYSLVSGLKIKDISERDEKIFNIIKNMSEYKIYKKVNNMDADKKVVYAKIAFLIMFLGCGERSSKIVRNYLLKFENTFNIDVIIELFSNENFREKVKKNYRFKYKLFGGHQSRLGHYFRNMFHIVKFIDSDEGLSFDQKNSYIKNFRVQLNTFEQALLLVNGIGVFGNDWSKYIVKYKLVKNIPKDFFGKDYWFDMEGEVGKMVEFNEDLIKSEYKMGVIEFNNNYFEFSKHELQK